MGSLVDSLTSLSERLERLPLEDLVDQARATLPALRDTLNQIRALAARLDTETAPQVQATLAQAQATLGALERGLGSGSPAQGDLRQALDAFAQAARALRDLADTLERHPESMIFGKGNTAMIRSACPSWPWPPPWAACGRPPRRQWCSTRCGP